MQSKLATFFKIPANLGGHLEFLRNMQKRICLRNGVRAIWTECLIPRVSVKSTGKFYKNHFLDIFGGHLEFLHTRKNNRFIHETFHFGIKGKTYQTQKDGHFYKIIDTHWDALFLLFLTCKL